MRFGIPFRRSTHDLLLIAALIAPTVVTLGGAAHAQSGGRRPLDGVVGVIGDRVILASTIERELQESYGGEQLDDSQRKQAQEDILRELAREEVWVQIGKVIGREDPDAFEQQIRSMLDDYKREQIDKYGSFTKMSQELEALHTTWQTLENEQRSRILGDSARQHAISQRFRDGFQLLVTPREMLDYFRDNPAQFAALDSADLAWISFPAGEPDSAEHAEQAATAWRTEDVAERDLAARFGGIALRPNLEVRQTDDDQRAAFLKEFARDGAEGEVLGPLARGSSLFVVKLSRKSSQPQRQFEEPDVQNAIRTVLANRKLLTLQFEIMNWKAREIMRIPPWILATR